MSKHILQHNGINCSYEFSLLCRSFRKHIFPFGVTNLAAFWTVVTPVSSTVNIRSAVNWCLSLIFSRLLKYSCITGSLNPCSGSTHGSCFRCSCSYRIQYILSLFFKPCHHCFLAFLFFFAKILKQSANFCLFLRGKFESLVFCIYLLIIHNTFLHFCGIGYLKNQFVFDARRKISATNTS